MIYSLYKPHPLVSRAQLTRRRLREVEIEALRTMPHRTRLAGGVHDALRQKKRVFWEEKYVPQMIGFYLTNNKCKKNTVLICFDLFYATKKVATPSILVLPRQN